MDVPAGLARMLFAGERRDWLDEFKGVRGGGPYDVLSGEWKGFAPEGTESRRPGVLWPL